MQQFGQPAVSGPAGQDHVLHGHGENKKEEVSSADWACTLIHTRQNISARHLEAPGPDAAQLDALLRCAGAAPDHGRLLPWRFVIVPAAQRAALAEAFAAALLERDAGATAAQLDTAREKAHRAPLLLLAVARLGPDEAPVSDIERLVSLGAATQNLLLAAHAMGFGAGLASGQALRSPRLHALFGLAALEQPACFISIGTAVKRKPARLRPEPAAFVSTLGESAGAAGRVGQ